MAVWALLASRAALLLGECSAELCLALAGIRGFSRRFGTGFWIAFFPVLIACTWLLVPWPCATITLSSASANLTNDITLSAAGSSGRPSCMRIVLNRNFTNSSLHKAAEMIPSRATYLSYGAGHRSQSCDARSCKSVHLRSKLSAPVAVVAVPGVRICERIAGRS